MHLVTGNLTLLPSAIKTLSRAGGGGVHIFIFCSGFGLYISYLKKPKGYIEFIKNRLKKIYIPYVIIVIVSYFIPIMYDGENRFAALLSHIFLYKMFIPEFINSFGPFWFISTIFQFYIIFIPLCYVKKNLEDTIFFILAAIINVCWWLLLALTGKQDDRLWLSQFPEYILLFVLGMYVAEMFYIGKRPIINNRIYCLIIAIATFGIGGDITLESGVLKAFNDIFSFVGCCSIALFFYGDNIINRFCVYVASFSYELYLVHMIVFAIMRSMFITKSLIGQLELGIFALLISIWIAKSYSKLLHRIC